MYLSHEHKTTSASGGAERAQLEAQRGRSSRAARAQHRGGSGRSAGAARGAAQGQHGTRGQHGTVGRASGWSGYLAAK
jgi:hypothetical protein